MLIDNLPHDDDQRVPCATVDPETFFPDKRDYAGINKAATLCQSCSVLRECLIYALTNNVCGVWGATSEAQRRRLRMERRIRATPITGLSMRGSRSK